MPISCLGCQCVQMVCCLFFSFAGQFGFGCSSLAQEMSPVICYYPALGSGLSPTHSLPSCLSCFSLLVVHAEISSLPLPLSSVHFHHSHPLCCCARLQFSVCYSVFLGGEVSNQDIFCLEIINFYFIFS
jgi:hypothetical protein